MKKLIIILIFFLLLILQLTIMPRISIFNVFPNILLAAVLVIVMMREDNLAVYLALFAGMAMDLFSNMSLGVYSLSFVVIAWSAHFLGKNIFRNTDFFGRATLTICSIFVYNFFLIFIVKIFAWFGFGNGLEFKNSIFKIALPEFILTSLTALILLFLFQKIHGLYSNFQKRI